MTDIEKEYDEAVGKLFVRFPSFQKDGASAYKPGIANMEFFDALNGHPHRSYPTVHVAGTNGKGSVCSMIASVLSAAGLRVGLYTSPHILDFRERMRIIDGSEVRYISREAVLDFIRKWGETFDHLDMSFFEITTSMAFDWFAAEKVDIAVIETGLGGRLDSTNIITPVLSTVTNIGLDHCDMLGSSLSEIAFEKAGIIKPGVPAVLGESDPEIDPVFERKVLYSNLSLPEFGGDRNRILSLLTYADKIAGAPSAGAACRPSGGIAGQPSEGAVGRLAEGIAGVLRGRTEEILSRMDLRGEYQKHNLCTALASLDVLTRKTEASLRVTDSSVRVTEAPERRTEADRRVSEALSQLSEEAAEEALVNAAARTGFHGRWETISQDPWIICDIGHNAHGLKYNFHQLSQMLAEGKCSDLLIVYGSVADKDWHSIFPLFPSGAKLFFTHAAGHRALGSDLLFSEYEKWRTATSSEARDQAWGQSQGQSRGQSRNQAWDQSQGQSRDQSRNQDRSQDWNQADDGRPRPEAIDAGDVRSALEAALRTASEISSAAHAAGAGSSSAPDSEPIIYIGGSTYIVSEAVALLKNSK